MKEMKYTKDRLEKGEILYQGIYKNIFFDVVNLGTHPCCYVFLPKEHKLYNMDYCDIEEISDVAIAHGGLTYSRDYLLADPDMKGYWVVGWDYAHYDDYVGYYSEDFMCKCGENFKKWTTEEMIEDCKNAIDRLNEIAEIKETEKFKMKKIKKIEEKNINIEKAFNDFLDACECLGREVSRIKENLKNDNN